MALVLENLECDITPVIGKKVVICEDEGITRMLLSEVLTEAGLDVVGTAANGKQGVTKVLREEPDIVLMDVKMPVMGGFEAAAEILKTRSPCLIMLTAFNDRNSYDMAKNLGASGYITKPVDDERLITEVVSAWSAYSATH